VHEFAEQPCSNAHPRLHGTVLDKHGAVCVLCTAQLQNDLLSHQSLDLAPICEGTTLRFHFPEKWFSLPGQLAVNKVISLTVTLLVADTVLSRTSVLRRPIGG
jgi:hypothetical protein